MGAKDLPPCGGLLAIDTSGPICTVALRDAQGRDWELHGERPNDHAEVLTPLIMALLAQAAFPIERLRALAICRGPGSYTGLRIGYATMKGLAYSLRLPLIEIPLLDALAHTMRSAAGGESAAVSRFLPLYATRGARCHAALFDGGLKALTPAELYTPEELLCDVRGHGRILAMAVGEEIPAPLLAGEAPIEPMESTSASGAALLDLASGYYEEKRFADVAYCEPFYVMEYTPGGPRATASQGGAAPADSH